MRPAIRPELAAKANINDMPQAARGRWLIDLAISLGIVTGGKQRGAFAPACLQLRGPVGAD